MMSTSYALTEGGEERSFWLDALEKLFDRFYRLDESRAKRTGGSGLGLNIAQTIVQNHGGTIVAHSGQGVVTFITTLP